MIVLVTDIFGRTSEVETLAKDLGISCLIVDPYQGVDMDFQTEANAYQHFLDQVGLDGIVPI